MEKKKNTGEIEKLGEDDKVAIVNTFMSSAFSNLTVSLNGQPIESHGALGYPYTSYIRQILSTSLDFKKEVSPFGYWMMHRQGSQFQIAITYNAFAMDTGTTPGVNFFCVTKRNVQKKIETFRCCRYNQPRIYNT